MILDLFFPKFCLECKSYAKYICTDCLNKVPLGGVKKGNISLFEYEGVIRKAVIALKYKFAFDVADELTAACLTVLESHKSIFFKLKFIVLAPIPLNRHRQNWRGFNQSEMVAEKVAKIMRWKYAPNLLLKPKETTHQVGLRSSERRKNLVNVFTINSNCNLDTDSSILLFDDIYTTGSTINEAKKVLNKAGFKKVYSLTIARQKLKYKN